MADNPAAVDWADNLGAVVLVADNPVEAVDWADNLGAVVLVADNPVEAADWADNHAAVAHWVDSLEGEGMLARYSFQLRGVFIKPFVF